MPVRLPPLSGLRLFEAAARCGSFKLAAHELGLTPSAFTHAIDSLEDWLDVQLFERHARGVVLTAAGRQYLPYVADALSTIATGTLRLPSRRFQDRVSISTFGVFAYKMLLPRLHKFRALYPNVVVAVDVDSRLVTLPSDEFDLAVRSGEEPSPHLSCDLLGRLSLVPVGTPHYIEDLSRDGTLDWSRATLIHISTATEDWEAWCGRARIDISSAQKMLVSTNDLALEAAINGLGLAIGRSPIVEGDIAAGRLAIAIDHFVPIMTGYWLVNPPGVETRAEIVGFRNWLLKEMSQLRWNGHAEGRAAS